MEYTNTCRSKNRLNQDNFIGVIFSKMEGDIMTIGFELEPSNFNLLQSRYLSNNNKPSVNDLYRIGN